MNFDRRIFISLKLLTSIKKCGLSTAPAALSVLLMQLNLKILQANLRFELWAFFATMTTKIPSLLFSSKYFICLPKSCFNLTNYSINFACNHMPTKRLESLASKSRMFHLRFEVAFVDTSRACCKLQRSS